MRYSGNNDNNGDDIINDGSSDFYGDCLHDGGTSNNPNKKD